MYNRMGDSNFHFLPCLGHMTKYQKPNPIPNKFIFHYDMTAAMPSSVSETGTLHQKTSIKCPFTGSNPSDNTSTMKL